MNARRAAKLAKRPVLRDGLRCWRLRVIFIANMDSPQVITVTAEPVTDARPLSSPPKAITAG